MELQKAFPHFIDVALTGTGRATHYNTREEQLAAIDTVHDSLFGIDRGVYSMACCLGELDYTKQKAVFKLLVNPFTNGTLNPKQEYAILEYLIDTLPIHRALKLFESMAKERVNNTRTRRLILDTILADPERLSLWAVKYRNKLRTILTHVWGVRRTSILYSILKKREQGVQNTKEMAIVADLMPYDGVRESVAFILGDEENLTSPLLKAYVEAKEDLEKGKRLPKEVLEGIRSTYHPDVPKDRVLALAKDNLTSQQKILVQKKAKEAGIEVEFDPMSYDMVKLYIYAFENGMTPEIKKALRKKANEADPGFEYENIEVVLDESGSMYGHKEQKLRPMAIALAMRDVLTKKNVGKLSKPYGATVLADRLLKALKKEPDAVFVITDGYENAPAGRFGEVLDLVRKIGNDTPVFQVTPVMGMESMGVRRLSESASLIPVAKPENLGLSLLRGLFEQSPEQGTRKLFEITNKKLKGRLDNESQRVA